MFKSTRASHTHTLSVPAPLVDVFPLFTPIHEQKWIPHWQCDIVYSTSPTAEELGVVFTTQQAGQADAVWVLSRYEPSMGRAEYVKIIPDRTACHIQIHCQPLAADQTSVTVTYTLTALSEQGTPDVTAFTAEVYLNERMAYWEQALSAYFAQEA